MHLYILTRDVNIDVSDITLENGYIPVISSRPSLNECANGIDLNVEPAVWFKVLVIDAISIDCNHRRISWSSVSGVALDFKGSDSGIEACGSYCSTDNNNPSEEVSRLTRSISDSPFDCGEFYAYDRDLDEVFDTVPVLVSNYQSNTLSKEEFHVQLMQLLHVYILPNIKLGCEDVDNVARSLKQQDCLLQEMDRKILSLSDNLQKRQSDRKVQRKKFVAEILSQSSTKHDQYPKELVGVLVSDISTDISEAWDVLEKVQKEVDNYKTQPLNSYDPKLLQVQRSKRDELFREYENLLTVRERLREMQNSKDTLVKKLQKQFKSTGESDRESVLYEVYISLTRAETEKVSAIRSLTDKKLLMLSVKEAMRTTLDELLKGKETFGVSADATGSMIATNVLNSLAAACSWQTPAEQIARVIADAQHPVAKLHFRFCAEVNARCLRFIENDTLFKRSSSESTLCIRGSGQSSSSSEKSTSSGNIDVSSPEWAQQSLSETSICCDRTIPKDAAAVECRDSAVSENSCYSAHFSLNIAHDIRDNNRDSIQSSVSVSSESSVPNRPGKKQKQSKLKSKKSPKSAKSTFHSYVDDGEQSSLERGDVIALYQRDGRSDSRREIEKILELIRHHFSIMCKELQQELQLNQQRHFRKIWLNYESHFYQETIENLIQIYQLEYNSITEALCKSVKTLTVTDLSLNDALLSHMLVDVAGAEKSSLDKSMSATKPSKESAPEISNENPLLKLLRNKPKAAPTEIVKSHSVKLSAQNSGSEHLSAGVSNDVGAGTQSDSSVCALRRRLSALPERPKTIRLSLNVQYPKMGVIVYERMLCPVRNSVLYEGPSSTDTSFDSPSPTESEHSSPRLDHCASNLPEDELNLCNSKLAVMKPKYKKQFALAFRCIDIAITTRCPSAKFQHLTKCLREVSNQISNFYQELYGRSVGACSDELMDALVILLCNVEGSILSQLYCQIMMLADIIPPFFDGSPFSFTLVQFVGACQFVQERIMLKRNRNSS